MAGPYQLLVIGHTAKGNPMSLKCYVAANAAAGTFLPCAQFRDAASTDPVDYYPPENWIIDDIQITDTGLIRVFSNGAPTSVIVDLGSRANSNAGRNTNLGIPLGAGKVYRFAVETQCGA
jgi:hypothetical protein